MTCSLRTPLMLVLVLAAFALPCIVRASTICYPDGCVVMNVEVTKDQLAAYYGNQTSLAQSLETIFQISINVGHTIDNVIRDAANRIVFLACNNSVTNTATYNNSIKCPVGYVKQGYRCVFSACPSGYVQQGSICIFATCPQGYAFRDGQCVYSNLCTTPPHCEGNDLMNSCTGATLQTCDWGCSGGSCNPVPTPSATLKAIPSLVKSGKTTVVSWTSQNVTSCTVTGTNGDSWTDLSSIGRTSSILASQVTYRLQCQGHLGANHASVTRTVIVNIAPTYQER